MWEKSLLDRLLGAWVTVAIVFLAIVATFLMAYVIAIFVHGIGVLLGGG